jgi:DNA-binding CsgD family transcriptional regulator
MIGKTIRPVWYLQGTLENGDQWTIPIDITPFVVGRSTDCNLKLLPSYISRKHAEILTRGSDLVIRDLRSKNGTFINERRIKDEVRLNDLDYVQFGNLKFRVVKNEQKTASRIPETALLKIPLKVKSFIDHYSISKREEEILFHLLQGKSTKKIADVLCISDGTAKNHILNIFKKTDTHSRFELSVIFNNFKV